MSIADHTATRAVPSAKTWKAWDMRS